MTSLPPRQPFWQLRTFVDALYSVILGYGFHVLANQFGVVREIYIGKVTDLPISIPIGSIILLILVFAMLIDDYARSRIINFMAPCRMIERFTLDITTAMFFGLSFRFIEIQSRWSIIVISLSFLSRAIWSAKVQVDAEQWIKEEEEIEGFLDTSELHELCDAAEKKPLIDFCIDRIEKGIQIHNRNQPTVRHWESFNKRLSSFFIVHLVFFGILLVAFWSAFFFDPGKSWWIFYGPVLIVVYAFKETWQYRKECYIVCEAEAALRIAGFGVLKTVVPIPNWVTGPIMKKARQVWGLT